MSAIASSANDLEKPSQRWDFSHSFLAEFQTSRSELEARVNELTSLNTATSKDVLDSLTLEYSKLAKSVVDAAGSLPNFDQRNCENLLKQLEKSIEELRKASVPTSKFAFKRKPKQESTPVLRDTSQSANSASSQSSASLTIASRSNTYLTPKNIPGLFTISADSRSDMSIADIDSCIINLVDSRQLDISALHVRDVKDSILLLPMIKGSVMLHNLERCLVVVGCHQFRMHTSNDVYVYLSIQSNPIIEHSHGILFAGYPAALSSRTSEENGNYTVQDFSHIKSTPSPNWSFLSSEMNLDTRGDWLAEIASGSGEPARVMQGFLPSRGIPGSA